MFLEVQNCRWPYQASSRSPLDGQALLSLVSPYRTWHGGTTLSYTEMILKGEQPQVWAVVGDADNGEDDDNGPEPGPKAVSIPVLSSIGSLHSTNQMRILGCG
jgi:hypothetical protein